MLKRTEEGKVRVVVAPYLLENIDTVVMACFDHQFEKAADCVHIYGLEFSGMVVGPLIRIEGQIAQALKACTF